MSMDLLIKNFGSKKIVQPAAPIIADVTTLTEKPIVNNAAAPITQWESVDQNTRCEACGPNYNFFWRWKNLWFCGRCRNPPAKEFVHEEFNGSFIKFRPKMQKPQPGVKEVKTIVGEICWCREDPLCSECRCHMVRETEYSDGTLSLVCVCCGTPARPDTSPRFDASFLAQDIILGNGD